MTNKIFIAIAIALVGAVSAAAQDFQPTDKWPYIFDSFTPGTIYSANGKESGITDLNICIGNNTVHFLKDGIILEADALDISTVAIGSRRFLNAEGKMMEVLASDDNGTILKLITVDDIVDDAVDLGYGIKSSTYSASNADLRAMHVFGMELVHAKVAEAALEREYGNVLQITETIYFQVGSQLYKATKKDFQNEFGKDETAAFLKANKVKWNDPSTLLPILAFIAGHAQ